jgi:hypothetical protein
LPSLRTGDELIFHEYLILVLHWGSAFSLAQRTFLNLAGMAYATYTGSKGYAWYATSYVSAIDPATHKVVTMAEAVILYVLPGSSGKAATVSATVGRGDFAALIEAAVN